jgi:ketosteroid isomerase-like protein
MRAIALFSLVASLLGCAPLRLGVTTGSDDAARAAIAAVSREFSTRYERGDAAGMVALYTPDGVILPPGRPALRGPAALTQYWALAPGFRVLEHRVTADSVVVLGPVAYDWGTYRVRTQDAAGAVRDGGGKYVIVWRETSPGVWRMHVDMWNAGPPRSQ